MVSDGAVLVVDETTPNNRYRFVGYHTYQASTGKYLNWTASSRVVLAWGEGEWDKSRETTSPVWRTAELVPTGVGSWLCRYNLDELPVLINVVRGDIGLLEIARS